MDYDYDFRRNVRRRTTENVSLPITSQMFSTCNFLENRINYYLSGTNYKYAIAYSPDTARARMVMVKIEGKFSIYYCDNDEENSVNSAHGTNIPVFMTALAENDIVITSQPQHTYIVNRLSETVLYYNLICYFDD